MNIRQLTTDDIELWADLLAICFGRDPRDMLHLWHWFHVDQDLISWGAWEKNQLIAHYSCLVRQLFLPNQDELVSIGLSTNMAVHPAYRGQGLIKQVSAPVYAELEKLGSIAGVGFSNADAVRVDRHSRSYGYHVVGRMLSTLIFPIRSSSLETVKLMATPPALPWNFISSHKEWVRFNATPALIRHRYAAHPFRHYRFGVWEASGQVRGVVIDHLLRIGGVSGVALLSAYTDNLPELLGRWVNSLCSSGIRFIHFLSTPSSPLLSAVRSHGIGWSLPYSRSPCYLTVKPLREDAAPFLLNFNLWNCTGGDVL